VTRLGLPEKPRGSAGSPSSGPREQGAVLRAPPGWVMGVAPQSGTGARS
jgi:hypothetical protein